MGESTRNESSSGSCDLEVVKDVGEWRYLVKRK